MKQTKDETDWSTIELQREPTRATSTLIGTPEFWWGPDPEDWPEGVVVAEGELKIERDTVTLASEDALSGLDDELPLGEP